VLELDEYGTKTGIYWGEVGNSDFYGTSTSVYAGINLNKIVKLNKSHGKLQTSFEVYGNSILEPETGILTGATGFIRYVYPLYDRWHIFIEGGAGPSYLSIDTREQGQAGFNFNDQIGFGVKYHLVDQTIFIAYRFSHLSHAGLRDTSNSGIEMHTFVFGFSW
jgi:hypothetical protein